MKLFRQGIDVSQNIFDKVKEYQKALRTQPFVLLNSADHSDHVAAYAAWQSTPGRILVMSPWLSTTDQQYLLDSIAGIENVNDAVFFHTSGTTGRPKMIQHGRSQFEVFAAMSNRTFEFDSSTRFLTLFPPFTSAFWHIVVPSFCQIGFEMHLSRRDTVIQDLLTAKFDATAMLSNLADFLRTSKQTFDFDSYRLILLGGAPVLNHQVKFLFDHGARMCTHAYGTTETGSPLMARKFTMDDQHYDHCDLVPLAHNIELKLVNQELWVRSPSLCSNYRSFSHQDKWRKTGDLWQENQGLIKYIGRNDDIIKVNGYPANLMEIENWWESHEKLEECVAKLRSIGGNDYIELLHTGEIDDVTKKNLKSKAKEFFPQCNIPAKFTRIDTVPKTSLGKKQRHLVR